MPQEFSRRVRLFTAVAGLAVLAAGCGGGGNGGNPGGGTGGGGGGGSGGGPTITVSGRVTFDRLPFQSTLGQGLNADAPVVSPAREVVVEAVTGSTVSSTTTDSDGNYSLSVPANSNTFIRVRAQMLKTGSAPVWNFQVKNNTNSDAVYVLQGAAFATGTANLTQDLHAPSGWTGTTYVDSNRSAAPFAILDAVYQAKQLILGAAPTAAFPALDLFWSTQNRNAGGANGLPCPDTGNIVTSFYFSNVSGIQRDGCSPSNIFPTGIYILGAYASGAGDTDEFDAHVIAHEFGHYFEDQFSRSDSIGGEHAAGQALDLRVAFGEGWGNAFGAMSLGDPEYRDSQFGISQDFGFNLETGTTVNEGWYSEASVGEILWDIFDANSPSESGDDVALGFAPMYAVMADEQVDTDALTSIFSFANAIRADNPAESTDIRALLQREEISGTGEFGTGDNNAGGDVSFGGVYRDITTNQPIIVCSTSSASGNIDGNKLGNRQFLRFVKNTGGFVTIRADGVTSGTVGGSQPAEDPDILVYRRGVPVFPEGVGESTATRQEVIDQVQLDAGTYVLEVYDFQVTGGGVTQPRCMTVSIQGT